jgi:hypothetical protein
VAHAERQDPRTDPRGVGHSWAERVGHTRRGGKLEIKVDRCPPSYELACSATLSTRRTPG